MGYKMVFSDMDGLWRLVSRANLKGIRKFQPLSFSYGRKPEP